MLYDTRHQERLRRTSHVEEDDAPSPGSEVDSEASELSCGAYGYLRGLRDQAASVEFRFRDGTSIWFPYSWLGVWQYIPSDGLLLKFSGDLVYLVLIRGSNLDRPLKEGAINLTHAGLQRHRVLWIREMNEEERERVGEQGPTIDSIEIASFDTHSALKEWLGRHGQDFVA